MSITVTSIIKNILLIILVIVSLIYGKIFLMPLTVGGILAALFLPFCHLLEGRKLPKGFAVFACFLLLLLIIATLIFLVGWKVVELTNDVSLLKQKIIDIFTSTQEYIFTHVGISAKEQLEILRSEQPSYSSIMQMVTGSLTSVIKNLVLVLVYFLFLLYYRSHLKNFLLRLSLHSQRREMEQIIQSATNVSQQYLLGLSKMIVCLWIMYGIGFSIIGVKNALFFAILCGLLEIVPFVGNITGTTLTVLVSALHDTEFSVLIGIVITYAIVQFIQGWVLEPLILGPQVKINPLFTILALVIGELLWGISGIILAIPITAIIKILCDHIEPLKPYGFLIGEIETKKKNGGLIRKIKNKLGSKA